VPESSSRCHNPTAEDCANDVSANEVAEPETLPMALALPSL
jgi:hypothetical protein